MNPVENGAGLAVARVLVPPSELPGSLPSGALPEAAGSLEPLGPRKASSRKKRAARFNRCSRGALKNNSCGVFCGALTTS